MCTHPVEKRIHNWPLSTQQFALEKENNHQRIHKNTHADTHTHTLHTHTTHHTHTACMTMYGHFTHTSLEGAENLQHSHERGHTCQLIVGPPGQVGEEGNAVQLGPAREKMVETQ